MREAGQTMESMQKVKDCYYAGDLEPQPVV